MPLTWQSTKIGAGPTPIETDEGWLLIYHGVLTSLQRLRLLDGGGAARPRRAVEGGRPRPRLPALAADALRAVGDVPNVVFPAPRSSTATGRPITIYYGGADTVVCLAHGHLSELLDFVRS